MSSRTQQQHHRHLRLPVETITQIAQEVLLSAFEDYREMHGYLAAAQSLTQIDKAVTRNLERVLSDHVELATDAVSYLKRQSEYGRMPNIQYQNLTLSEWAERKAKRLLNIDEAARRPEDIRTAQMHVRLVIWGY